MAEDTYAHCDVLSQTVGVNGSRGSWVEGRTEKGGGCTREVDDLSQQAEVRLVGDKCQHDKVSIQTVEAMPQIWGVSSAAFLPANVFHNLVLALPWHIMPCTAADGSIRAMQCAHTPGMPFSASLKPIKACNHHIAFKFTSILKIQSGQYPVMLSL